MRCNREEQTLVDRVVRDLDGDALKELFRMRTAKENRTLLMSGLNTSNYWADVIDPLDNEEAEQLIGPAAEIALEVPDDRLLTAIFLLRGLCSKATRTRIPRSLDEGLVPLANRVWDNRDLPNLTHWWKQVAAYYVNAGRKDPERGGRFTLQELTFGEGL